MLSFYSIVGAIIFFKENRGVRNLNFADSFDYLDGIDVGFKFIHHLKLRIEMDYIKKAIWGPDPKEQVCYSMINCIGTRLTKF